MRVATLHTSHAVADRFYLLTLAASCDALPRYNGAHGSARAYVRADGEEREAGGATLQIEGAEVAARGTVGRRGRPGVVANWADGGTIDTSAGGAVQACQGKSHVHDGAEAAEEKKTEEEAATAEGAEEACSLVTISLSNASWTSEPWAPGLLILVSEVEEELATVALLDSVEVKLARTSPPLPTFCLTGVRAPRHALQTRQRRGRRRGRRGRRWRRWRSWSAASS